MPVEPAPPEVVVPPVPPSAAALLLFWLASGNLNLAQQPANLPQPVSGVVRTPEGTPVPTATVHLINTGTNKTRLSWTDESGKFEVPQIPASAYRVEASQLGFANASLVVQLPVVPPGPIPIVLRVATLAELAAKPEATHPPRSPRAPSGTSNPNNANAAGPGGQHGGRGSQVPVGMSNAISAGLAGGGFEQTDLTVEGAGGPTGAANAPANETTQVAAESPTGAGTSATSDSFLSQGTVGHGLAGNGPGGFGQNGMIPGNPAGEGGPGGQGLAVVAAGRAVVDREEAAVEVLAAPLAECLETEEVVVEAVAAGAAD